MTARAIIQAPPLQTPVSMKSPGTLFAITYSVIWRRFHNRRLPIMLCACEGQSRPSSRSWPSNSPQGTRAIRVPHDLLTCGETGVGVLSFQASAVLASVLARSGLLTVHGRVGARDQRLHSLPRLPLRDSNGRVDFDLHFARGPVRLDGVFAQDPFPHALDLRVCRIKVAIQNHDELVSAPAANNVSGADVGP